MTFDHYTIFHKTTWREIHERTTRNSIFCCKLKYVSFAKSVVWLKLYIYFFFKEKCKSIYIYTYRYSLGHIDLEIDDFVFCRYDYQWSEEDLINVVRWIANLFVWDNSLTTSLENKTFTAREVSLFSCECSSCFVSLWIFCECFFDRSSKSWRRLREYWKHWFVQWCWRICGGFLRFTCGGTDLSQSYAISPLVLRIITEIEYL